MNKIASFFLQDLLKSLSVQRVKVKLGRRQIDFGVEMIQMETINICVLDMTDTL